MTHDPEIEQLRRSVHCATVLERQSPPWKIDRKESTKHCLKYRRGSGEILILNHEGHGWWDPHSDAKGDVFDLIQHFEPNLNFGEVRKVLRQFIGLAPAFPKADRESRKHPAGRSPAERWADRPKCAPGSPAWSYLARQRRLPPRILAAAGKADVLREGPHGSAWFAHRGETGCVTHVEIRGQVYKGSLKGGAKSLFRFAASPEPPVRFVLAEAPIDALSLAAIEGPHPATLYAATGGGMGPATIEAIQRILAKMASLPNAVFCGATDANAAGERYAAQHQALAAAARIGFTRLRPLVQGGDWNDALSPSNQRTLP